MPIFNVTIYYQVAETAQVEAPDVKQACLNALDQTDTPGDGLVDFQVEEDGSDETFWLDAEEVLKEVYKDEAT